MEGRNRQLLFSVLSGVLSLGVMGCLPANPLTEVPSNGLPAIPSGGWLVGQAQTLTAYDAQGQVLGEQRVLDGQTLEGSVVRPATGEPIVILTEGDTWVVSLVQAEKWTPVYSSKVAITSCDLSPNGHALVCVQAGDLNLIRFSDQHVQRLDNGVVDATWSPTNTDLLVSYADHTDLLGLDLDDEVATRTVLLPEFVEGVHFLNSNQVVWWNGNETEHKLQLYHLRTKEQTTVWAGFATPISILDPQGKRVTITDDQSCDPSCTTTVLSLPQGAALQTTTGALPVAWNNDLLITATPQLGIDQESSQTYHFSTLNADGISSSLGVGLFFASEEQRHVFFTL